MLIDWFTVVAQIVNFLILVWLLKRFLYQPILDAIDSRETRITEKNAQADAAKIEAQKQRDDFEQKNATFDQELAALLKKATEETQAERERLLEAARKDADALSGKRSDELLAEQQSMSEEITRRIHEEVFSLARKTLQDLAAVSLEERICDVFIQNVGSLNGEVKKELAASVQSTNQPIRVRSAFALPPEQRTTIQTAMNELLCVEVQLKYETVPNLISGIELTVNGKKLAWSVNEYLDILEKQVEKIG